MLRRPLAVLLTALLLLSGGQVVVAPAEAATRTLPTYLSLGSGG